MLPMKNGVFGIVTTPAFLDKVLDDRTSKQEYGQNLSHNLDRILCRRTYSLDDAAHHQVGSNDAYDLTLSETATAALAVIDE